MDDFFIMHNPLTFNLLNQIGQYASPLQLLEFLTHRCSKQLNSDNYLEYLEYDLSKQRKGLIEMLATDSTASHYIANQLARLSPAHPVILTDLKRRTIPGVIKTKKQKPLAVFITTVSSNFPTAVITAIVLNYAKIPVIIGGIHVSTSPDDVAIFIKPYVPFPDIITQVCGGGDSNVMKQVLHDLENHAFQPTYFGYETIEDGVWGQHNISYMEPLRLDWLNKIPIIGKYIGKHFIVNSITPYSGCPHACNFCSISTLPRKQRELKLRSPEDFLAELSSYQKHGVHPGNRAFFFIPDNLLLGGKHLEKILDMIIASPLKINWAGQISIDVAKNHTLLEKLRLAGATRLLIGLESLDIRNLEAVGKHTIKDIKRSGLSVRDYYSLYLKKILDHGMTVIGAFIFGLPFDYFHSLTDNSAIEIADFCLKNHISLQPSGLTDLPGSINFKNSIENGTYRYGKPGTMDYLLGLCITDLSEGNHQVPDGLKNSPLVVAYMIYQSAQRVGAPAHTRKNARYIAKKAWQFPTQKGRRQLFERCYDAFMGWGIQWIDSLFREAYAIEAYSRNGSKGTFERLYDQEQNPEVKTIFKEFIQQFKEKENQL